MFVSGIGRGAQRIIDAMVRWLAYGHINPNILTVIGVAINVGSGLLFGLGYFFSAGIVLIVANLFDMLDGQVARLSGQSHPFRRLPGFLAGPPLRHGRICRLDGFLRPRYSVSLNS